jgi:hypothetical protein
MCDPEARNPMEERADEVSRLSGMVDRERDRADGWREDYGRACVDAGRAERKVRAYEGLLAEAATRSITGDDCASYCIHCGWHNEDYRAEPRHRPGCLVLRIVGEVGIGRFLEIVGRRNRETRKNQRKLCKSIHMLRQTRETYRLQRNRFRDRCRAAVRMAMRLNAERQALRLDLQRARLLAQLRTVADAKVSPCANCWHRHRNESGMMVCTKISDDGRRQARPISLRGPGPEWCPGPSRFAE